MFQDKGHVSNIQSLLTNGIIKATLTGKQVGVHEHTKNSHNITVLQQTTATENHARTKQMVTTATTGCLQLLLQLTQYIFNHFHNSYDYSR